MENVEYKPAVKAKVLDERTFLKLTLSKKLRDDGTPWMRITVRPVAVKDERGMQFSYFDGTRDVTRNFFGDDIEKRLDEVLAMPFGQIHAQSTEGDVQVLVSRKGNVHMSKVRASIRVQEPDLSHDHAKQYLLPADGADPLLRALGILTRQGKVRSDMSGKFRQINEFLRIIDQALAECGLDGPVRIADCGCGSAYLTFAAFHYLNHFRGVTARVVGVDLNDVLIGKCEELRESLGWDGLEFRVSNIAGFQPDPLPDIVLCLHACDTATDEALAQAVRWKSRVVLAAPCCQHELHDQLKAPALRAVLRHGILRERLADVVTDAFRALALRIMGYRTDVIEFVSPEATSKNVMIRARRGVRSGDPTLVREYNELKAFWEVTPAIERLLGEDFQRLLPA